MDKCVVSFEIPSELFLSVHDLAAEKQGTISTVFEDLLVSYLQRFKTNSIDKPKYDDRLVMALQKLLFRDLAEADSWDDLNRRLASHGYFLKICLGGMALHTETSGQKLCNLHDLGFSYGQFVRRFGPDRVKDPIVLRRAG